VQADTSAAVVGFVYRNVMAGLVPAIHVLEARKAWMPGIKPGMTVEMGFLKR
jgi:hypothetical protein